MWFDVSFGSSRTGIGTVGYRQVNSAGGDAVARTQVGVVEIGGGGYGVDAPALDAATRTLEWDTGGGSPIYAHESVVASAQNVQLLYADGVWIDTSGGAAAGTVVGVNGIQSNPVSNIADAITLAAALNIKQFKIAGNVTLPSALVGYQWEATEGGGVLDPNGFDVSGSIFDTVGITGDFSASGAVYGFQTSILGPCSGLTGIMVRPGLAGTLTGGAGVLTIAQGSSLVPGFTTPIIDLDGVCSLNLRAYSGGLDLRGSSAGGQSTSLEFTAGQVVLDASNTAGAIAVRGIVSPITNNAAGATVSIDGAVEGIDIRFLIKLLRNRRETDPNTGIQTIYDDDGVTPLVTGPIWEDIAGTIAYSATSTGIDRQDPLV
jgi:hypothetical protein